MVNIQLQEKILFKIRNTCLEMLTDRGYKIPDIINDLNYNDFKILFSNKNINLSIDKTDNDKNIFVFSNLRIQVLEKNDLKKSLMKFIRNLIIMMF